MKKRGFTLAETVIVIATISFLAVILLGSLSGMQPDKEKVMFKKAYQITERTVGELVNDESIYPYDPNNIGFFNTSPADVEGTNISYSGNQKFCMFFARKLNTFANAVYNAGNNSCTFQTTDGISWIVPSVFSRNTGQVMLTVDVNGTGNGPDTRNNDAKRDIFDIYVDFDGRVSVKGGTEIAFLQSHNATTSNSSSSSNSNNTTQTGGSLSDFLTGEVTTSNDTSSALNGSSSSSSSSDSNSFSSAGGPSNVNQYYTGQNLLK